MSARKSSARVSLLDDTQNLAGRDGYGRQVVAAHELGDHHPRVALRRHPAGDRPQGVAGSHRHDAVGWRCWSGRRRAGVSQPQQTSRYRGAGNDDHDPAAAGEPQRASVRSDRQRPAVRRRLRRQYGGRWRLYAADTRCRRQWSKRARRTPLAPPTAAIWTRPRRHPGQRPQTGCSGRSRHQAYPSSDPAGSPDRTCVRRTRVRVGCTTDLRQKTPATGVSFEQTFEIESVNGYVHR